MRFYDISMKMLIASFRRYRLYFLCNVFSVVLFYSFAAIFTNKSFMDMKIVDSSISGNIYAPSLFAGIFLVLFIPYSYNAFMKNRKHEYGILMTLGMSEREVLTNMLIENCVIAGLSLIISLIVGTVISFVFYFIIQYVIGVSGLNWYFNLDSYKWTVFLYGATILFTMVTGILGFIKMQLTDMLKEKYKAEKKGKPLPGIFAAGVVLVTVSVALMMIFNNTNMWLAGLIIMFMGLWMTITHAESVEQYFINKIPGCKGHHILGTSFVRHHNRSRRKIGVLAAWMIGFSVFFGGLSIVLYPGLTEKAITYSPYDLVYSKIFGKNQAEDSKIESLLNQNGVSVKTVKQVEYLRNNAFNLFPESDVNKEFNCSYKIPRGKFLMLSQYDLNDGYEHEMTVLKTVDFNCGNKNIELQSAGSDVKILFNINPTFADKTLILNDADYDKIASESKDFWKGVAKLYSFRSWKDSGKGIDAVQNYLWQINRVDKTEQNYFKATSRIEATTTAKQSAEFFIFLMFFIVVLFCGASNIIIHFKIKSESEEEQRMLSGLYRLGVTPKEMLEVIRCKNIYYYIPQVIIGLFLGVFCNYMINRFYSYEWKAAGCSLIVGVVFAAFQLVVVRRYSRRELLSFDI